jgi:hypothetical protein
MARAASIFGIRNCNHNALCRVWENPIERDYILRVSWLAAPNWNEPPDSTKEIATGIKVIYE